MEKSPDRADALVWAVTKLIDKPYAGILDISKLFCVAHRTNGERMDRAHPLYQQGYKRYVVKITNSQITALSI